MLGLFEKFEAENEDTVDEDNDDQTDVEPLPALEIAGKVFPNHVIRFWSLFDGEVLYVVFFWREFVFIVFEKGVDSEISKVLKDSDLKSFIVEINGWE